MTTSIEEVLRSGAWRLVPVEATPAMIDAIHDDAVVARHRYAAALAASPDHTPALVALIEELRGRATKSHAETRAFWDALVPKGPRCRDCADFDGRCQGDGPPCAPQEHALENLANLKAERDRLKVERDFWENRENEALKRALAAEAKCDALREALAEIIKADTHLAWTGGEVPEPSHEEFGVCAEIAARAPTPEASDV